MVAVVVAAVVVVDVVAAVIVVVVHCSCLCFLLFVLRRVCLTQQMDSVVVHSLKRGKMKIQYQLSKS